MVAECEAADKDLAAVAGNSAVLKPAEQSRLGGIFNQGKVCGTNTRLSVERGIQDACVENLPTRDEIFGPVPLVVALGREEEARRRANSGIHGLSTSVGTDGRARRVIARPLVGGRF